MGRAVFLRKLLLGWILLVPPFLLAGRSLWPLVDPAVHDPLVQALFVAICYLFTLRAAYTKTGQRALENQPLLLSLYRFALLAVVWAYLLSLFDRIQTLPIGPNFAPTLLSALPGWAFTLMLGFQRNPSLQARRLHIPLKVSLSIVAVMFIVLICLFGMTPPETEIQFRAHWMNVLAFLTMAGALLNFSRRPAR